MAHKPLNQQNQSPLFRLPFEIRLEIYELLLGTTGCSAIHILTNTQIKSSPAIPWNPSPHTPSRDPNKLNFEFCVAHNGDPFLMTGTHYDYWPQGHLACSVRQNWRPTVNPEERVGTNFLLTCQRIYDELTDLIYTSLRFELLGLVGAERFFTNLTPSSLSKIRKLHISFQTKTYIPTPKHPAQTDLPMAVFGNPRDSQEDTLSELWIRTCSFLPLMASLTSLRITIFDDTYPPASESRLLEPLIGLALSNGNSEGRYVVELGAIDATCPFPTIENERLKPFVVERRAKCNTEWDDVQIDRVIRFGNRPSTGVQVVLMFFLPFIAFYYLVNLVWEQILRGWRYIGEKLRARYNL